MKQTSTRNILSTLVLVAMLFLGTTIEAQLNTPRGSQLATVKQRVGITDIYISYSRPKVNKRGNLGKISALWNEQSRIWYS